MNSKSRDSWSPDPVWIGFRVTLSVVSCKCSKRGDSNLFHGNVLVSLLYQTASVYWKPVGEGGEVVMTLRLAIIVSLQVKRVSVCPPAIHRHYHLYYKVS